MPPLCTAGYGLATAQFSFFFGALYLFTINTVFIALAGLLISQLLNLPIRGTISDIQKKRINQMISLVMTLVLIPSIYFGYVLVQKENFTGNASKFIDNVSLVEGNYLLKNEIDPKTRTILLVYGGTSLSDEQKEAITARTADFSIKNVKVEFRQGFSYSDSATKNSEVETLKSEIHRLNMLLRERNAALTGITPLQERGGELLAEIEVLYPQIEGVSYSQTLNYVKGRELPDTLALVTVSTRGKNLAAREKEQIEKWLATRLKAEKIKVWFNE